MVVGLDLDRCSCRSGSHGRLLHYHLLWLGYNGCWRSSRSTTLDGLDIDVLDLDHIAMNDGVDLYRLLTLVMNVAKRVVQLEVRVAEGASAEKNWDDD